MGTIINGADYDHDIYKMTKSNWLPWSLLLLRLFLGPFLLLDASDGHTDLSFVFWLGIAILSDILDGIVARRLGVASQRLRRLDSLVDSIFFFFVAAAAWLAHRDLILQHRSLVYLMIALSLLSQLPAFIKFRRAAAFHAYSAKASGLALLAAGAFLFGYGLAGPIFVAALWVAIISHIERILITLVLPNWQTDIAWLGTAWKIRKEASPSQN
jgi:CDP-diacylglycerol--glycerol-3-phosphate 3-phosphatidyltransferase